MSDTNQTGLKRDAKGRIIGGTPPAGFNKHPENISPGGWDKEMVFSYQYRRFMNMTVEEIEEFARKPKKDRKVVEDLAYSAAVRAKKSLPDVKEMTDRTEGKAPQSIDLTTGGDKLNVTLVEFVNSGKPDDKKDSSKNS